MTRQTTLKDAQRKDARGLFVTGASAETIDRFETALADLQCYINDPMATIEAALAEQPDFAMGHIMKAHMLLSGTEPGLLAPAKAAMLQAAQLPLNDREMGHVVALRAFLAGEWERAEAALEAVLVAFPRDILALQMAHLFDFFRGDARNLRDRVVRRLAFWQPSDPGYHALCSMHAFGLEEMGDYARAEEKALAAVALQPRDGWGHHAIAHVNEMLGRTKDGITWMTGHEADWAKDSFFAVHNWWHLALNHLDLDETDQVLAIYDDRIRGTKSQVVMDLLDASAMLWRLHLRGVDVGERWHEVADAWQGMIDAGLYAFNDCHALMSFIGAGRTDSAKRQMVNLAQRAEGGGSNGRMSREVGKPVGEALIAFGEGRFGDTVDALEHLRPIAHRFGGSHAQRDLLDLTLIEAAKRAGRRNLVAALAQERRELKPANPLAQRYANWAQAAKQQAA